MTESNTLSICYSIFAITGGLAIIKTGLNLLAINNLFRMTNISVKISDLPYKNRVSSIKSYAKTEGWNNEELISVSDYELLTRKCVINGYDISNLIPLIRDRLAKEIVISESDEVITKAWQLSVEGYDKILVVGARFNPRTVSVERIDAKEYASREKKRLLFFVTMVIGCSLLAWNSHR